MATPAMPIPNVSHNGQSWHWAKLPTLPLWLLLTAQWFLCGNASTSTSESASASASASTSSRHPDSDSVQALNEIIPAMLLSFRGCSLMGEGLKSLSVRVRQQRLLNWLPLAANDIHKSTSRSFSLSCLLFIEIYCIFNKIGTRYDKRDSTFSRNSEKS